MVHSGMQEGSVESSHGSVQNRILSTFLNELDGVFSSSNKMNEKEDVVFVLIACKELDNLDEALIRPGLVLDHPDDICMYQYPVHNSLMFRILQAAA